jgi:hypothetical protein
MWASVGVKAWSEAVTGVAGTHRVVLDAAVSGRELSDEGDDHGPLRLSRRILRLMRITVTSYRRTRSSMPLMEAVPQ